MIYDYNCKKIEFGVNSYDYNMYHILTLNASHTDIIQTHTQKSFQLKNRVYHRWKQMVGT